MSEMVERVARAIYAVQPFFSGVYVPGRAGPLMNPIPWDQLGEFQRQPSFEKARAAIEAMREPTTGLIDAMCSTSHDMDERLAREMWGTPIL